MKNWIVYGTIASTGEEDQVYVLAESKASALDYIEEYFGASFHVDYIFEE